MDNKNFNWRPVSEYTGGRVLATNGLDVIIGEINSEGDCESEENGSTILCGITGFIKIEEMLPELKESEEEKIRKDIIKAFKVFKEKQAWVGHCLDDIDWDKCIAWLEKQGAKVSAIEGFETEFERQVSGLIASAINKEYEYNQGYVKWTANALLNYAKRELEKQGEQKPADKVEQKFHKGDWIIHNKNIELANSLMLVTDKDSDRYLCKDRDGQSSYNIEFIDKEYRLWTIKDAKDGDVLATKDAVFIFKHIDKTGLSLCKSYCEVIGDSKLGLGFDFSINGVKPAAKEQREQLEKAMADAGYTFDFEKKELKKIEKI